LINEIRENMPTLILSSEDLPMSAKDLIGQVSAA